MLKIDVPILRRSFLSKAIELINHLVVWQQLSQPTGTDHLAE